MLEVVPVTYRQACAFIEELHRHHKPPQGHKFSVGAAQEGKLVGVACIGRPVARHLDDGITAEVTRLCSDGTRNVCSLLYGAAWRAAKAMGYRRIITYTLLEEDGSSLRASNWTLVGERGGGNWNGGARQRADTPANLQGRKNLWQKT